jgi:hypothetical protein
MKACSRLLSCVISLFAALAFHSHAADAPKPAVDKPAATTSTTSATAPSLRKPGYVQVQSGLAELTFIDPKFWGPGPPFHGKVTGSGMGVGIEIGIVVADLDKAYAAALKFKDKGWPVSTGIVMRPWGVRDFRVIAPDGYYLRFTEGR